MSEAPLQLGKRYTHKNKPGYHIMLIRFRDKNHNRVDVKILPNTIGPPDASVGKVIDNMDSNYIRKFYTCDEDG